MLKSKYHNIAITEFIFFLSLFLLEIRFFATNLPLIQNYSSVLDLSIILMLFINVFIITVNTSKNKNDFIKTILIIILGIISWYFAKNPLVLKTGLLIISVKNINFEKIIHADLLIKITIFFLVVFLYFSGYISSSFTSYRDGILRNSWGFSHPNTLGLIIAIIYFEVSYLYFNKKIIKKILLAIPFICFISIVPNSRSAIYVITIFNLLSIIKVNANQNKINNFIYGKNLIFILFTIISLLSIIYYRQSEFINDIDVNIMSNRIYYQEKIVQEKGYTMLGKHLTSNVVLDNSYIYILVGYGITILVISYILYKKNFLEILHNNNTELLLISLSILVYGLFENSLTNIICNIFILYPFCKLEVKHA